ncbi:DUF3054 domain-containing protein [Corynebacterium lizhenjunii]|uniref:DUF3054 domain-containing protein n=1 Tax=Corynebacterium lizhenjunii TaxID=2709394 RepID=UPI0013EA207F|nr:DUF3054 domain-containing protein [Corynebacterium lizhenjunii]
MRPAPLFDICALILFALFARAAHPPFTFSGAVDAFWPWAVGALVGWGIVSVVRPKNDYGEGAIVWPCAIGIGMLLWILVNGHLPHYTFLLVASIMSFLLMFGWRVIAMRRNARGARNASSSRNAGSARPTGNPRPTRRPRR